MSDKTIHPPDFFTRDPFPWPVRFLLSPVADFHWRRKIRVRLTTADFVPHASEELQPGTWIDAVPITLRQFPLTLRLQDDGKIYYEYEYIGSTKPPVVKIIDHSESFNIILPEPASMAGPFVSSDGRFVSICLPEGPIYRLYTFQDGQWLRWIHRERPPGVFKLIRSGLRNYFYFGSQLYNSITMLLVVIAVAFFLYLIFAFATLE